MQESFVDRHCFGLGGAKKQTPFGEDTVVWKVGGHMFAAYMRDGEGVSVRIQDKISAQKMVGAGQAKSAPYLKGEGWVLVPWSAGPDILRKRLNESYNLILKDASIGT